MSELQLKSVSRGGVGYSRKCEEQKPNISHLAGVGILPDYTTYLVAVAPLDSAP